MNWSPTSRREAWKRLRAAAPPAWVLKHCAAVERLAFAMAKAAQDRGLPVDLDLVLKGAVLHDIGRSITQDVRHASLGADLLRREGWPAEVVCIVERHTGAGITPAEAEGLGLPERDYVPETLEEQIVAHADNLHSGPKRLLLHEVVEKYRSLGLEDAALRVADLHGRLEAVLAVELEGMEPVPLPDESGVAEPVAQ